MLSALAREPHVGGIRRPNVGRWTTGAVLALSARTVVYTASDERGERCALKVRSFARDDEQSQARLVREIELTDAASIVGSPALLGYGSDDHGGYLATKLLDGGTLAEHNAARGGRFDLATALLLTERLLIVAERLHRLGIVHHEIQADNVFITAFGEVILLDYSAAEIAADPREDVYAIGALLFWMLAGTPLKATHPHNCDGLFIDDIAHLPCDVLDFIELAVSPEPQRRLASASVMRMALSSMRDAFSGLERQPHSD